MNVGDPVTVDGYEGVAFRITAIDHAKIAVRMVGDDKDHIVDVDDCHPLDEDGFCPSCGQIACMHFRQTGV